MNIPNTITFIIPNRGGSNIDRVIKNFTDTFSNDFTETKFIVVEQCDSLPFMRGQLYNIAFNYVDTEYVALIDNDIINLNYFNISDEYNKFNHPYIAFDKISQLTINDDDAYDIIITEDRSYGFGAFNVLKSEDFEIANGFSNLCAGWGREDNILNYKFNFERLSNTLGHISHEKRANRNSACTTFNSTTLEAYKSGEIDGNLDGFRETKYSVVYENYHGNVLELGVDKITVDDDFTYIEKYKEMKSLVSDGLSIVIAAYNTADYIQETLDSIQNQRWCKENSNYEILVGVDGCEKTLAKMKEIQGNYKNLSLYYMEENKGTFIAANTLISQANYNKILRFDSDDFFVDDTMLGKVMSASTSADIVRYRFKNYISNGYIKCMYCSSYGSFLCDKKVFDEAGGFVDWRCAGDHEFYERVHNHFTVKELLDFIYTHRVREDSLMHDSATSMDSEYRNSVEAQIREYSADEDIYVEPVLNYFTRIVLSNTISEQNLTLTNFASLYGSDDSGTTESGTTEDETMDNEGLEEYNYDTPMLMSLFMDYLSDDSGVTEDDESTTDEDESENGKQDSEKKKIDNDAAEPVTVNVRNIAMKRPSVIKYRTGKFRRWRTV